MKSLKSAGLVAGSLMLLGLAGCATKGDIEALRSEIAGVRATAEAAEAKATQAAAEASQAAEDARLASEKADRVFQAGLRK
jgi:outer membrane murein-binding lipoprotein Lpp